jgi:hypothetical protein
MPSYSYDSIDYAIMHNHRAWSFPIIIVNMLNRGPLVLILLCYTCLLKGYKIK